MMVTWILENIGTLLVCGIIGITVTIAAATIIKDKRNGKSSCGGNCVNCPMGTACNKAEE